MAPRWMPYICSMKQFLAWMLMVVMGLPSAMNCIAVGNYLIQYRYYAEVLCENKDVPALKCNGTCQLAEALQAEETPQAPSLPELADQFTWPAVVASVYVNLAIHGLASGRAPVFAGVVPSRLLPGGVFNPPEDLA